MEKKVKVTTPRYQKIAVDIASKIIDKQYDIGKKIYARSTLASQYGVSSETARRAISMLCDMDIVESIKGSGVIIKSYENAVKFVRQYNNIQTVNEMKKEVLAGLEEQVQQSMALREQIVQLVEITHHLKAIDPFAPFEIELQEGGCCIGKTISEVNFWHNTGATIIAIRHGEELILSPGPYAAFRAGDKVYFVGDEDSLERVSHFLST